jgi:hypothetical protein
VNRSCSTQAHHARLEITSSSTVCEFDLAETLSRNKERRGTTHELETMPRDVPVQVLDAPFTRDDGALCIKKVIDTFDRVGEMVARTSGLTP